MRLNADERGRTARRSMEHHREKELMVRPGDEKSLRGKLFGKLLFKEALIRSRISFPALFKGKQQGGNRIEAKPARVVDDHGIPGNATQFRNQGTPSADVGDEANSDGDINTLVGIRETQEIAGYETQAIIGTLRSEPGITAVIATDHDHGITQIQ